MAAMRTTLMKSALVTMHALKVHALMRPLSEGLGMILTLHRVRPQAELEAQIASSPGFLPNALLEITPAFFDAALTTLKGQGLAIISLDEAIAALKRPTRSKRFVVVTFDDGYIDNRDHALPVLEAHDAPATLFMPSSYPQGEGEVWWVALEDMIRSADHLTRPDAPDKGRQSLISDAEKTALYLDIYWALRAMDQDDQRRWIRQLAKQENYSLEALCKRLILSTQALIDFAAHPLITIGAHTVTHRAIARLTAEDAMMEMVEGANWLEQTLGERPRHFAFPYGDPGSAGPRDFRLARDAGFVSALTTRKGMIYPEHRDHLHGLPRVSLNGSYQQDRFIELFASGAPFLLANGLRKVA